VRISRWDVPPTVVGVTQPGVRFLPSPGAAKEPNYDVNATVDSWIPAAPDPKYLKAPYWNLVARLREGTIARQGQQELALLSAREAQSEKGFEGFTSKLESVVVGGGGTGCVLLPASAATRIDPIVGSRAN
jgi:putative ABC transport system permease protein